MEITRQKVVHTELILSVHRGTNTISHQEHAAANQYWTILQRYIKDPVDTPAKRHNIWQMWLRLCEAIGMEPDGSIPESKTT